MNTLTQNSMIAALEQLGVRKGDIVLTHSSLKSFGRVENGPLDVVEAISEAVGETGTSVFPVFHFLGSMSENLGQTYEINLRDWPSRVGAITETARKTAGFVQSIRPYHSLVARGTKAEFLMKDHEKGLSNTGPGTPFEKMRNEGARILLLGVDSDANTFLHHCEETFELPYIYNGKFYDNRVIAPDGSIVMVKTRGFTASHPRRLNRIDRVLRERSLVREGNIGSCHAMLIEMKDVFNLMKEITDNNPYFLVQEQYTPEEWKDHEF